MGKQKTTDNRSRNFASIGYTESLEPDWMEVLNDYHIPAIISPLHDKDVHKSGELKKPHYHVMLLFSGKKSPEQVKPLFEGLGFVGMEIIQDGPAMARYFCHLDNPEKYPYNVMDVKTLGGIDYFAFISKQSDRYAIIGEMLDFIEVNQVESFSQFLYWCSHNEPQWFRALADSCAYIIREHIKSKQYSREHNLNPDTSSWVVPEGDDEDGE